MFYDLVDNSALLIQGEIRDGSPSILNLSGDSSSIKQGEDAIFLAAETGKKGVRGRGNCAMDGARLSSEEDEVLCDLDHLRIYSVLQDVRVQTLESSLWSLVLLISQSAHDGHR